VGQALAFFGIVITVLGLIHYYLWRRLVRATTRTSRARRIGTWTVVALALLVIAAFAGSRVLPRDLALIASWIGFLWLAAMFYLLVGLAVLELPALVARIMLRRRARTRAAVPVPALVGAAGDRPDQDGGDRADEAGDGARTGDSGDGARTGDSGDGSEVSRRLFLARTVAITAGLAAAGLVSSGIGSALGPPRLTRVSIPLARLPRSADGLRIALISDIHLGPLRGIEHTRRVVEMVNGLDADFVSMVGDLVDGSVAELGAAAAPLREMRSKQGTFFVTGNHEYFSGHEEWLVEIERLGMRPLRNEWLELAGGLDLAGVNDPTGGSYGDGPDFDRALAGRDPARPVVMLSHQPVQAQEAAARGVDLQLSGHTHGGQMVPFNLIVRASGQPVVSGLGEVDGMPVYVTNGAGFWGPPVRVGAPPDITLVDLRAGA
jgi:hypothetical protein